MEANFIREKTTFELTEDIEITIRYIRGRITANHEEINPG